MVRGRELAVVLPYGVATCAALAVLGSTVVAVGVLPSLQPGGSRALTVSAVLVLAGAPFVGALVRSPASARRWAIGGTLCAAWGFVLAWLPPTPWIGVALASFGVLAAGLAAAVVAIQATPGRYAPVGLVVSLGLAGLALGGPLGRHPWLPWLAAAVALGAGFLLAASRDPAAERGRAAVTPVRGPRGWAAPLLAVASLGFVAGMLVLVGPGADGIVAMALAAALGPAVFGWMADLFGPARLGVAAAVVTAACTAVAGIWPSAAIAGVFAAAGALNIALALLAEGMPERPGLAMGIAAPTILGFTALGAFAVSALGMFSAMADTATIAVALGAIVAAATAGFLRSGAEPRGT